MPSSEKRGLRGKLTGVFSYIMEGGHREGGVKLFLEKHRSQVATRKIMIVYNKESSYVVNPWEKLPREAAGFTRDFQRVDCKWP